MKEIVVQMNRRHRPSLGGTLCPSKCLGVEEGSKVVEEVEVLALAASLLCE